MASSRPNLGSVLITGGTGFLGTHIVEALHSQQVCTKLTVLDIKGPVNPLPGVNYIEGSLTSPTSLSCAFDTSKPDVVFHAASPNFTTQRHTPSVFFDVNVKGTEMLLAESKKYGVKAFVYTSTIDAYAGHIHNGLAETAPLWNETNSRRGNEYALSKALADGLVLKEGNTEGGVPCAVIRPAHLYGDGDTQAIPVGVDACAPGKPLVQLGNGQNVFSILSTENCAQAQILLAQALLDPSQPSGQVSGQAFNISDGPPVKFWEFFEILWSEVRGRDVKGEIKRLPAWLVWSLCSLIEWAFKIGTLGRKIPQGPELLERYIITICLDDHWYNSDKAKRVLGYSPTGDWKAVLRQAVRWEVEKRKKSGKVV